MRRGCWYGKMRWAHCALTGTLALGLVAGVAVRPGWFAASGVTAAARKAKKRLILSDGAHLDVVRFSVREGEVEYLSAEDRGWQVIPAAQVDWKATREWARKHPHGVTGGQSEFENISPAEAAREESEVDREEAAQREAVEDLMPEVKPGLRLPDEDGVFALDEFKGRPELMHLRQADGDLNQHPFHSVQVVDVDRMHGFADLVRMQGAEAAVQLHVEKPVFYVSVRGVPLPAPANAFVVNERVDSLAGQDTGGGASRSRFVIVKVVRQGESRVIYAVQLRDTRGLYAQGRRIQAQKTVMAGGHWMKLTPVDALEPGEYALVEVLDPGQVNRDVWDFGVNPQAAENPGARLPVKTGR